MSRSPKRRRAPAPRPQHRYVSAGGYSATISGALKIFLGVIVKLAGWGVSEAMQSEIVQGVTMLIGIGLDLWGAGQVYHARQSRGDVNALGKRVADVEVIVAPETPPPAPPA